MVQHLFIATVHLTPMHSRSPLDRARAPLWEQEKEIDAPAALTPDEEKCEETFVRIHKRTAAGRYIVRLPFSSPPTTLAKTRKLVERLLTAMERKFGQDFQFGNLYRSFM